MSNSPYIPLIYVCLRMYIGNKKFLLFLKKFLSFFSFISLRKIMLWVNQVLRKQHIVLHVYMYFICNSNKYPCLFIKVFNHMIINFY